MNNIGTIIKIDGNEAIVMCDDCIFRKVKREDNMCLGQKILVGDKDLTYRNKRVNYYIGILTSVAAVFLVLFSYFLFNQRNGIYAYVDVDINPSLRILIDGRGKVEKVDPINDDAMNIIKDLDAKGKPLKEAILSLIDVSRNQGIIDDSEVTHILICAALNQNYNVKSKDTPLGEEGIEDLLYDIGTDIDKAYNGMIQSETIRVSSKPMEISEDNDISMGKCLIYEKAKERGLGLSVEELKSERLADILEKYNFDFNDLGNLSPKVSATPENQPIPTLVPTERTAQVSEPSSTPNATAGKEPVITSASTLKPIETVTQTPIMTSKATPTEKATPTPSATPRPIPTTVKNGNGIGLRGEYYDNMDLTKFKFAKVDPVINFEWGEGSPADAIDADSYSIRWTGKVEPRYSDTYTFYTNTDDGVRLWVNGVLLIDKWQSQSATEYSGKIDLVAGKKYEIKMEYYDHRRGASAKLMWSSLSQQKEIIPSSQLYPSDEPLPPQPENGLKAEYFGDKELGELRFGRMDDVIDFDWQRNYPVSDLQEGRFSVRWTGKIQSKYTEEYTIHALSDDGVRVWIDNILIIDNWKRQESKVETTGKFEFKEGKQYSIIIEYFNYGGPASMKLLWSSTRQEKQVIPLKYLFTY
jgi:hypothetical protein